MIEGERMADETKTRRRRTATRGKRSTGKAPARRNHTASPGGLIATMRKDLGARMGSHKCTGCNQQHSSTSKASVAREIGVTTPTLDKFLRSGNASGPTIDRIHGYLHSDKA